MEGPTRKLELWKKGNLYFVTDHDEGDVFYWESGKRDRSITTMFYDLEEAKKFMAIEKDRNITEPELLEEVEYKDEIIG